MRVLSLALAGLVCAAALSPTAQATTSATTSATASAAGDRAAAAADPRIIVAANGCGRGWHWVPPGYAKRGKWRNGHCSPN